MAQKRLKLVVWLCEYGKGTPGYNKSREFSRTAEPILLFEEVSCTLQLVG